VKRNRRSTLRAGITLAIAALSASIVGAAGAAIQAAPVNSAPPTITGTPSVGETLTAQNGTWTNSPTAYQYQWLRCGTSGESCVGISGSTQKTYVVASADSAHTLRVRVTAVNADGATNARSAATSVVGSTGAPKNTVRPTITGEPTVGQELTADPGTWSGTPTSYAYQWQRCDIDALNCFGVSGATGKTYGVRDADTGYRLAVVVTATNSKGSDTARSNLTDFVEPSVPITNGRPTIKLISVKFVGARVYARVRICDDSNKNVSVIETDSKPGKPSYTRRFSTLVAPQPCGVYTRNWLPALRFRGHGRYTLTLKARDKSGSTSAAVHRTFFR
jgi:hypothetical protein